MVCCELYLPVVHCLLEFIFDHWLLKCFLTLIALYKRSIQPQSNFDSWNRQWTTELGSRYTPGIQCMPKGYIVFVGSVSPFIRPSFLQSTCPSVIPSINPFYNQVLLRSFLITYNSAATDQKLSMFGMGVPGRILFHSTSMNPWVMPWGGAGGQKLGHPNKVVY